MAVCCWKKASHRVAKDLTDADSQSCQVAKEGKGVTLRPDRALKGSSSRVPRTSKSSTGSVSSIKSFVSLSEFMYSNTLSVAGLFGYSDRQLHQAYNCSENMFAKVDLNNFLKEKLVPVQGFACRTPADPKREPALRALTYQLNESLRAKGCVDRKLRVPPEAFCRVSLDTVGECDGNANLLADRAQLVRLGVKVHGKLLFPPGENHRDRALETKDRVRARNRTDGRWHIGFEVKIALERSAEDAHEEDAMVPALQVKIVDIDIANAEDSKGDAMTDSWLPKGDILRDVEALIDDKLQEAITEACGGGG